MPEVEDAAWKLAHEEGARGTRWAVNAIQHEAAAANNQRRAEAAEAALAHMQAKVNEPQVANKQYTPHYLPVSDQPKPFRASEPHEEHAMKGELMRNAHDPSSR